MKQLMLILGVTILLCFPALGKEAPTKNPPKPSSLSEKQKPAEKTPGADNQRQTAGGESQKQASEPEKQKKGDATNNWWTLTLFLIPALVGLIIALSNEYIDYKRGYEVAAGPTTAKKTRPRFLCAFLNGLIWMVILVLLAYQKEYSFNFFNKKLDFELYVPIFGFLGSLLYVLDISRRGRQDIPVGAEFGMRIIMGPYVAIVVVVLFGQNFEHVDLSSPIGRGTLAFSSGLVVVATLQRLIEASQEKLGKWRKKSRYEPSEIAREFDISEEDDLKLRKADLRYLIQLKEYPVNELKDKVRNVGFDVYLAVGLKEENDKRLLDKAIGDSAWETLKNVLGIQGLEEFAHLTDEALNEVIKANARISLNDLKKLRDKAKIVFGL